MQMRADLAPVGFTYLPEREVALRLGGNGIINQIDWPNAKAIKNFLRHTLIADIAHARLAAQEGAVPVKLGFCIDSYDEYRCPSASRASCRSAGLRSRISAEHG